MAKVREIRRRIRSVESTKQITRAMEMVATSKIKRAQVRIENLRPYTDEMEKLLVSLIGVTDKPKNALTEIREIKNIAVVAITADRGLCGAFNTGVIRKCESLIKQETSAGRGVRLFTVGRKALGYFRYIGQPIASHITGISDSPTFGAAIGLADELVDLYSKGEVDKVVLIYNRFVSALNQLPVEKQLLPIEKKIEEGEEEELKAIQYLVEPSIQAIFPDILKSSLESIVFQTLADSSASEWASRRKAMKAATENAEEMIFNLSRSFNRARQALITQEIAEIVGGADALEHSK